MAEKLKNNTEAREESSKELKDRIEALRSKAESEAAKSKHEHKDKLESIRSTIESEAKSKNETDDKQKREKERSEVDQPTLVNKELKNIAYRRTLKRTQSKLKAPERVFSKFIHNPVVEAVSEVGGKTIARPSGVLLGGIFAFLGSSAFLWIVRHYGYEYNYLLFALFFVGGFFVGLAVELGLKLASRK